MTGEIRGEAGQRKQRVPIQGKGANLLTPF